MSTQDNISVVEAYLAGRGPELIAEDATFHDYTLPEPIRGTEEIAKMFHAVYNVAFPGAEAEFHNIVANDNCVVLEFTFRGVNTGSLMGKPPTGRRVEVPMCVVYDVEDGVIRRARLYYDSGRMDG
ncbi:MAG: nuclear transport factor 2 family protein [Anaerolineae bacterium]|nr:nuclear transport factor 2 family protein [Anaerolineae bacterium]